MANLDYNGIDNLEVMQEAKNYNAYLLDLIEPHGSNPKLIVDFGAGSGTFALPMVSRGHSVTCVEPDTILSNRLAKDGVKVLSSIEYFDDNSVDYLYSLNVLEHIENDDSICDLWYRKLRSGGTVLVYVPAFEILYTSMDKKVGHFRRYTKRSLEKRLFEAGFLINKSKYVDSLGYVATLLFKIFDNGSGDLNRRLLVFYDKWVFPLSRVLDLFLGRFFGKNVYVIAKKN